jgi:hypothetical protein
MLDAAKSFGYLDALISFFRSILAADAQSGSTAQRDSLIGLICLMGLQNVHIRDCGCLNQTRGLGDQIGSSRACRQSTDHALRWAATWRIIRADARDAQRPQVRP